MSRLVIICALCLVGILGCKTDEERCLSSGGKILNAVEAKKVYQGNTMTGEIPSQNMQFQVHYSADGAVSGRVTIAGSTDTDRGAYAISDNGMLCTRWVKWHAFNGCIAVYQDGETYKMFNQASGELMITQKMLEGDPMKLAAAPPPKKSETPTTPEATGAPTALEASKTSAAPTTSSAPNAPGTPTAPAAAKPSEKPATPAAPVKPATPVAPSAPAKPGAPTVPIAP